MSCSVTADIVSVIAEEIGDATVWRNGSASFDEALVTRRPELAGVSEWLWLSFPGGASWLLLSLCSGVVLPFPSSLPGLLLRHGVYSGRIFSVRRSASSSDWPVPPSSILSTSDSSSAMIFLRPLLRLSLHNGKFHMWGEGSV